MNRPCATLRALAVIALLAAPALPALAGDLSSASYQLRGGHVSPSGAAAASASWSSTGSLGQSGAIGPSGSTLDLSSVIPGFSPIVAGALPSLDLDGDGAAYFVDTDDDGDGLDDVVETNTHVYASPSDTGTDPLLADTDGDGATDGTEVGAGSDPNDPLSFPMAVPVLGPAGQIGVALLIGLTSTWAVRPRRDVRLRGIER